MRPRAAEVSDNSVALGDQIDDLHLEVGERASKRADPASCHLGERAIGDLVEDRRAAPVHALIDKSAYQLLVLRHWLEPTRRSMHPAHRSAKYAGGQPGRGCAAA